MFPEQNNLGQSQTQSTQGTGHRDTLFQQQAALLADQNNWWQNQTQSTQWAPHHVAPYQQAFLAVPENSPQRWVRIAEQVPEKSPKEIIYHDEALVHDISKIVSDRVELPTYADDVPVPAEGVRDSMNQISFGSRPRSSVTERRKGTKWTEEEHRQFLMGLEKYGKGDWRGISRNCVLTRTPSQVASHAQKYFLRQSLPDNKRRRASIHDITTVDANVVPPANGENWVPPQGVPMQQPQEMQQLNPSHHFPDMMMMGGYGNANCG